MHLRIISFLFYQVTAYDFLKNNVNVKVFDTPGLADATGNDEEYLKKMKEDVSDLDLFLFCTEMNTKRFRTDDFETMKKLTTTFGPELWDHAVVVLTFANEVPLSPSSKTKNMSEKDIFVNRFSGFKRKIKDVLIQLDVPEAAAINVPFVPAGDSDEPRLPDRENWLTAFWVAAFKRINRNAKAAFLLANADRITFSSLSPSDEKNAENEENDDDLESPSAGLSSEEVKAIKEMKKKLKEVSFEKTLNCCLLKPRAYDELGEKSVTSQNQVAKGSGTSINMDETYSLDLKEEMVGNVGEKTVTSQKQVAKLSSPCINVDETSSFDLKEEMVGDVGEKSVTSQKQVAKLSGPFINVDETSSHDIIKEMIGEVTGQFVGDLTNKKFGRYYQTFFKWLMRRFKRLFPAVRAIKDKPENEKNEDTGEKEESETEDE